MYKEDLALNNQQRLICHKTPPTNQPINYLLSSNISLIPSFSKPYAYTHTLSLTSLFLSPLSISIYLYFLLFISIYLSIYLSVGGIERRTSKR